MKKLNNISEENKYNILLIITDQERNNEWIPKSVNLPGREKLKSRSLSFNNHYTHTSPCSPSRATIFTGKYIHQHGVKENSSTNNNTQLKTGYLTLGKSLKDLGYYTAYKGKWHLQSKPQPQMEEFGFADWFGNDMSFWGLPNSGTEYDPLIYKETYQWLKNHSHDKKPWFLCTSFVNPHDIMWFPVDQKWFWKKSPEYTKKTRLNLEKRKWGRKNNLPGFDLNIPEYLSKLPVNFYDDLNKKPNVHRVWMDSMLKFSRPGYISDKNEKLWLQQINYYLHLHVLNDYYLENLLHLIQRNNLFKNTIIIFTSDHGDQCGSHKLRSKGPWNYEETMKVPLYITTPDMNFSQITKSLSSHIDLARTIIDLAGGSDRQLEKFEGKSLTRLLNDPSKTVRNSVYFAQEWPWYPGVEKVRYANTGYFDGKIKYSRYYGIGGGVTNLGLVNNKKMRVTKNSNFDDFEHELYDLSEDPHEINNIGYKKNSNKKILKRYFNNLNELENLL